MPFDPFKDIPGYTTHALDAAALARLAQIQQAKAGIQYVPDSATQGSAKQPTAQMGVVCTKSGNLNLRIKPIAGSTIVRAVPKGTVGRFRATIVSGWVEFRPLGGGDYGFAASQYICQQNLSKTVGALKQPTKPITMADGYTSNPPAPQPSKPIVGTGSYGAVVCTKTGPLNLRPKPAASGGVLASMPKGTTVVATPTANAGWVKVKILAGGKTVTGYASAKYICRAQQAGTLTPLVSPVTGKTDWTATLTKYRTPLLLSAAGLFGVLLVLRRRK